MKEIVQTPIMSKIIKTDIQQKILLQLDVCWIDYRVVTNVKGKVLNEKIYKSNTTNLFIYLLLSLRLSK